MTARLALIPILMLTACKGGCTDEDEKPDDQVTAGGTEQPEEPPPTVDSLPKAGEELGKLVPETVHAVVYSDDVASLRQTINESKKLQTLFATEAYKEIMSTGPLAGIEAVGGAVARLADAPAGEVVVDDMLKGPGLVALTAYGDLTNPDYLIIKQLDMSQEAVVRAASWWLKAGHRTGSEEIDDVIVYRLNVHGSQSYHYVLNGALVLSNDWVLIKKSAGLVDEDGDESIAARERFPQPKGLFSMALNITSYRESKRTEPLALLGLDAIAFYLDESGEKIDTELVVSPDWGQLKTASYVAHRYVPKDAPLHFAFTSAQPEKVLETFVSRSSQSTLAKLLGVRLDKKIVPALDGEVFYTFVAPGLDHVLGFKLAQGAKIEKPLRRVFANVFYGDVDDFEPEGIKVTGGCGGDLFCFAIHDGYLLMGPEETLTTALKAATGKHPALADQKNLKLDGKYAAAANINLESLSASLYEHIHDIADPAHSSDKTLIARDVKEVLGPFFKATAQLGGWGGTLAMEDATRARGTLQAL